jgi:hypothetical protein
MTDKEVYLAHWTPTLGKEEALKSWEAKQSMMKRQAPMVAPDIQPYQSMIDGSWITSRSHHRTHLRDHGCIEIGNEKQEAPKSVEISRKSQEERKRMIGEIVYSKLRY